MPQKNNLAFGITYNGTELMTSPTDSESVYNAMTRTIEQHTGSRIAEWGRCKMAGEHYRYPIMFADGERGEVFVGANV